MNKLAIAALVTLAASSVWAVQGTVFGEKGRWTGDITWQARTKTYVISYKKGTTAVSAECPLDNLDRLDVDKPAGFDKYVDMVRRGQGSGAIAGLTKIVADYKMLIWDKPAGRWLVEAYLSANNAQKAFEVASGIIRDDRTAAWTGDLAPAYWKSLLKLGKTTQLENCLRQASSAGDRGASAAALVMRGDMILAAGGDTSEAFRQALTDGYLRVALLYADCKEQRAEAMRQAAQCFDKLGMAARAEAMRSQANSL